MLLERMPHLRFAHDGRGASYARAPHSGATLAISHLRPVSVGLMRISTTVTLAYLPPHFVSGLGRLHDAEQFPLRARPAPATG